VEIAIYHSLLIKVKKNETKHRTAKVGCEKCVNFIIVDKNCMSTKNSGSDIVLACQLHASAYFLTTADAKFLQLRRTVYVLMFWVELLNYR